MPKYALACHPEPVEGRERGAGSRSSQSGEAYPPCFDAAQHDTLLK